MDPATFRQYVRERFGVGLTNATPANVRAFAAWFHEQQEVPERNEDRRYVLPDLPCESAETGLKRFFEEMLEEDAELARQRLWVSLLEFCYGVVETDYRTRLDRLFSDLFPPDQG